MNKSNFEFYDGISYTEENMKERSFSYRKYMSRRRSIRFFSDQSIPQSVIEDVIMTASSAPSGAHKQPWTFCAVSCPEKKRAIRQAAEKEEYQNYHGRMNEAWLRDLEKFDTDWQKPFLEKAPWLIILFKKPYDLLPDGQKANNYYVNESVGIAAGFLISALHYAGLVTLTHTPSPMNFLEDLLVRPKNERAFLLLPVGYPAIDAQVPILQRKKEEEVLQYY